MTLRMIKRVNFTDRRKITRDSVTVEIQPGRPRQFTAEIRLEDGVFPSNSKVYLEATSAGSAVVQRYRFGSVGAMRAEDALALTAVEGRHVFFTLKVVDDSASVGRILGIARHIRPPSADDQSPLGGQGILPIDVKDLGQQLWRLEYEEDVCLFLNNQIPDVVELVQQPWFACGVYPSVVQQVLTRILNDGDEYADDDDRWEAAWLRFGKTLHPEGAVAPPSSDRDDRAEWINDVVTSFCEAHSLRDRFVDFAKSAPGEEE
jgi:hypothetical protein